MVPVISRRSFVVSSAAGLAALAGGSSGATILAAPDVNIGGASILWEREWVQNVGWKKEHEIPELELFALMNGTVTVGFWGAVDDDLTSMRLLEDFIVDSALPDGDEAATWKDGGTRLTLVTGSENAAMLSVVPRRPLVDVPLGFSVWSETGNLLVTGVEDAISGITIEGEPLFADLDLDLLRQQVEAVVGEPPEEIEITADPAVWEEIDPSYGSVATFETIEGSTWLAVYVESQEPDIEQMIAAIDGDETGRMSGTMDGRPQLLWWGTADRGETVIQIRQLANEQWLLGLAFSTDLEAQEIVRLVGQTTDADGDPIIYSLELEE